jgi:hypothetical protein
MQNQPKIFGILSIILSVFSFIPYFLRIELLFSVWVGLVLALLAIILALIQRKKAKSTLTNIAIVLAVISILFFLSIFIMGFIRDILLSGHGDSGFIPVGRG